MVMYKVNQQRCIRLDSITFNAFTSINNGKVFPTKKLQIDSKRTKPEKIVEKLKTILIYNQQAFQRLKSLRIILLRLAYKKSYRTYIDKQVGDSLGNTQTTACYIHHFMITINSEISLQWYDS